MQRSSVLTFAALLGAAMATAQVSITPDNLTYSQDFNRDWGATESGTTVYWENDVTLPGFYIWWASAGAPAELFAKTTIASSSTGDVYLHTHTSIQTDFIIGSRPSDANAGVPSNPESGIYYAVRLVNDTGQVIDSINLSYLAVQWYHSTGPNANTITPGVLVTGANTIATPAEGEWREFTDLTFTAPRTARPSAGTTINFHTVEEVRFEVNGYEVGELGWDPGEELWVRWFVPNVGSTDQGLGLDNIEITAIPAAIPEPATLGIVGLLAGLLYLRRRRS